MPTALDGQVAVVTGGGQGIGFGITRSLLEAGASVVISQRSQVRIDEALSELSQYGSVAGRTADASIREDVEDLINYTVDRFGHLDILVANHGISAGAHFLDIRDEQWDAVMNINLKGMFICSQIAARRMVAQGSGGRIILISSICATAAEPECAHYNASKGGVSALCKSMAVDLARYDILTNAIAPGWIRTPVTEAEIRAAQPQCDGSENFPINPLGRIGLPRDIGNAVAFLADPSTSYISGSVLTIDGAQTAALATL